MLGLAGRRVVKNIGQKETPLEAFVPPYPKKGLRQSPSNQAQHMSTDNLLKKCEA